MARKRPARRRQGRLALLLIAAAALVGLGYLLGHRVTERTVRDPGIATGKPRAGKAPEPTRNRSPRTESDPGTPNPAPAVAGRVAIVIDDLGRSLDEVERLLALGVPLGYAVLPWERRTAEVAARLSGANVEILCHLPMESSRGANPGRNAILEGLRPEEISALTRQALDALPGAIGVNNHMGSLVTAESEAMRAVLEVVAERGLYFLDSRTTVDTVAFDLARSLSIPAARRDVFLDVDPSAVAVEAEFDRLLALAREKGAAIAIGHPHEVTLALLERRIPEAKAAGFEFVPVSYLVERGESLP